MLQWFRARASCLALAALASMATVGAASVVPHEDDCHDAACRSIAIEHDASDHRIGEAAAGDDHPLHCVVCHWVRAFRPPAEARIVSTLSAPAAISIPVQRFTTSAGAPVSQPPLRSPPSSPIPA